MPSSRLLPLPTTLAGRFALRWNRLRVRVLTARWQRGILRSQLQQLRVHIQRVDGVDAAEAEGAFVNHLPLVEYERSAVELSSSARFAEVLRVLVRLRALLGMATREQGEEEDRSNGLISEGVVLHGAGMSSKPGLVFRLW